MSHFNYLPVLLLLLFFKPFYGQDLQILINEARTSKNKTVVLEEDKVYSIEKPLVLYSNITIEGNNAILTQSKNWEKYNSKYDPLIRFVDINNTTIKNVNFNHSLYGIDLSNQPSNTILMIGAVNCTISNCTFKNLGGKYEPNKVKGSPFVLILSQDAINSFTYLPEDLKDRSFVSSYNTIDNCKFINRKTYISFAIRVLTNWTGYKKRASFESCNINRGNKIANSVFIGEYDWNTIEIAGPRTLYNIVIGNTIYGESINNIDIDKGASFNKIIANIICGSGLPSRHFYNKNVRYSAIAVHGADKNLLCRNNTVINNKIIDVKIKNSYQTNYLYSSAIGILYTEDTTVKNNVINNIFDKDKYGVAILIDQYNKDVKILNNSIKNAYRGVYESLNSRKNISPQVKNNKIITTKKKVFLKNYNEE